MLKIHLYVFCEIKNLKQILLQAHFWTSLFLKMFFQVVMKILSFTQSHLVKTAVFFALY